MHSKFLSVLSLSAAILSLTSLEGVEASPLLSPGRHAPPYLASKLGNHRRALLSFLGKGKAERDSYYGEQVGMAPPPSVNISTASLSKRAIPASMPNGWAEYGCVDESNGQRVLQGFGFASDQTTAAVCAAICGQMGFQFSGTEYGSECYCGNSFVGSGGNLQPSSDCSMPCGGDSSQMCGQAWRLSVYVHNATSTSAGSTLATAPSTSSIGTNTVNTVSFGTATATTTGTASIVTSGTASGISSGSVSNSASGTASITGSGSLSVASAASSTIAASSAAPSASATAPSTGSDESEWYSLGCARDSNIRVLSGLHYTGRPDMTVDVCLDICEDAGYDYAGVEYGNECYCGNSLPGNFQYIDDSQCNMPCAANSSETCGGGYAIDVYELATAAECGTISSVTPTASSTSSPGGGNFLVLPTTTTAGGLIPAVTSLLGSVVSAVIPQVSTTSAAPAVSSTVQPSDPTATGAVQYVSSNIPSSSSAHNVYAHHMVGNTYPYGRNDWANDIALAKAAGIDGFALNMGSDWWQPARVADAYAAAAAAGGFTMFLSLDMTSLGCGSPSDANNLINIVKSVASSPAQTLHNGKVLVSTFSGENCYFGQNSVNNGWNNMFKNALSSQGVNIFFVPSIFADPSTFGSDSWIDGELNWNSGWPMGGSDLDTSSDTTYMNALGSKEYMPAISPYFFTHFPPSGWNKNWIYRGDDWLYLNRWEQVIAMRDRAKFTEILTWNDYGESSYIGPIAGGLPAGSEVWVNNFPHTALLDITKYYATAFKTGAYPAVTKDQIIVWARPHSRDATAYADSMSKPDKWQYTDDNVYAAVFATAPGVVTLTSGSNSQKYTVVAGLNKIKLPMSVGSITAQMTRNGQVVTSYDSTGKFAYTSSPATYNFNYFVGSS